MVQQPANGNHNARETLGTHLESHSGPESDENVGILGVFLVFLTKLRAIINHIKEDGLW